MPENKRKKSLWIAAGAVVLILIGAIVFYSFNSPVRKEAQPNGRAEYGTSGSSGSSNEISLDSKEDQKKDGTYTAKIPENGTADMNGNQIIEIPAIDYRFLDKGTGLGKMMKQRKEKYGLTDSVDLIVRADESFIVGGRKVSMEEILEKAAVKRGEIYEKKIDTTDTMTADDIREYGIHVVQPGDNVWNIHFNIIKDYYDSRGISVEPKADEPDESGMSSGVGKILKFSEKTVIIYNLAQGKIDTNIDLIEPLTKIVVYNLSRVFTLLEQISYKNVNRVKFDGTTLWVTTNGS